MSVAFVYRRLGPLALVSMGLATGVQSVQAQEGRITYDPNWSVSQIAQASPQPAAPAEKLPEPVVDRAAEAKDDAADGQGRAKEEKVAVSKDPALMPNATVNLINILAQQGVLTQDQAKELIPQADDETMVSREAIKSATDKADEAAKAATAAASAATPKDSKRVSYVPEVVKQQLRSEIRREVMTQAKEEGWASPGTYPKWASRMRFFGDVRTRYEANFYPGAGYALTGSDEFSNDYIDYNAINSGSPYDVNPDNVRFPPLINGNQDRERFRMRARLGMEADLSEGFTAGMRIATGSDRSPVSTNQTMGGSGGNFSKYSLWLDRAFLKYDLDAPVFHDWAGLSHASIKVGRFDNPFWRAGDLVWDNDLGFDGIAAQTTHTLTQSISTFAVAGAFPIFNTALDFGTTERVKFESHDKYLFGGQLGVNWKLRPQIGLTLGASFFDYYNVKGEYSKPCDINYIATECDTDATRPSFAQRGNTYMYLRDVIPPPGWSGGNYAQPMFFGLVSDYMPLVLAGRLDFAHFDPVHITFDGEFVWNTAFNRAKLDTWGINNRGPVVDSVDHYDGGNMGWMGKITAGHSELTAFGDWKAHVGYKYLESDATLDAFADSDFGLGGTNLKGYFLGGEYALSSSVWTSFTWMSASAIAGAPYAVDLLQLDLNAKF